MEESILVYCNIDGKDIYCENGSTIFEAAKLINIEIPNMCYSRELSIGGNCRICSVEIEGEKILKTACSTPVKDGMIIKTNTQRVINSRRIIIELMLSQHFGNCMICDAAGECLLEKYSYEFGVTGELFEKSEYNESIHGIDEKNPFIVLDRGKCILCGKCIRACSEWSHRNAISFVQRGNKLSVSTLYNNGLEANKECIFCGNCITICSVGALSEKSAIRGGRFPEVTKTKTICPYCGVGCGIIVYEKDNKIIKVRGDIDAPANKGRLCIKGKFGFDFVNSPDRLTKPLIKNENGEFVEISFLDAIIHVCRKIDELKAKNGIFAGISSARCTNEENYIFQKFIRTILETDNIDHCARICHSSSVSGLSMTVGSAAMTNPIEDIDKIDCFLVIGSNMANSHPVISWKIISRIKQGAILILIDPRKGLLSSYATIHLQLNPGSDIHLLNAMMKVIIDEHTMATDLIENRTEGFEELKNNLEKLDFDTLVKATGLNEIDITLAARLFVISGNSTIFYAMGITQHKFGTANVISISNLSLLAGKIGNGPMGINPLRGQNNVQGSCDMGALPGVLPGYGNLSDKDTRDFFHSKWEKVLPKKVGKTINEIFTDAKNGEIDFLYIMGENPVISDPDSDSVIEGLKNTGFVVIQDLFLTETAKYADIVFPVLSFAEKDGTFTNTERRIQRINKVINKIAPDVYDDWYILTLIANNLKAKWKYNSWLDIFNEIRETVDIYSHIDPEKIDGKSYFWPHSEYGESEKRLYQNTFNMPNGKAKFIYQEPNEIYTTNDEFPYLLIIGRLYEQYHTGTMTRKTKGIDKLQPSPKLYINPKDAMSLKIKNDDWVTVKSANGKVELQCELSLDLRRGHLFTSFHYSEAIVNKLTSKKELDPYSKMAPIKVVPVNIERM